ncbi:C40 family peptidase [Nocardioides sp. Kera G14]|uniref:C40 family peptidase n=1 Tax=Nocardioides sp. Kera G14 TaxID=2884264 RepID=UPI001D12EF57|nr:C40 family peptidase [Nocardioides sp. Kera G14]UDY23734.1 C40 family peptidase [Nocardioides sp. Kera G14]
MTRVSIAALFCALFVGLLLPAQAQAATSARRSASVQVLALKKVEHHIMRVAASRKGTPYRYGGTGNGGFDCSGYTRWVFNRLGIHLPRTSASQVGSTTRTRHPRVGDLVFFSHGGHVYHVAIYAGHHSIWHAPYSGTRVRKERIWTGAVFYGHVKGMRKAVAKQARKITARRARAAAATA